MKKLNTKFFPFFIFYLAITISSSGQFFNITSESLFNPVISNPAQGAIYKATEFQFSSYVINNSLKYAPKVNILTSVFPLNSNMGINLNLWNNQTGFINQLGFGFAYFYHFPVSLGKELSFGLRYNFSRLFFNYRMLSFGMYNFDPVLINLQVSPKYTNTFDFGIFYKQVKFEAGFSYINFLNRFKVSKNNFFNVGDQVMNFFITKKINFANNKLQFLPSLHLFLANQKPFLVFSMTLKTINSKIFNFALGAKYKDGLDLGYFSYRSVSFPFEFVFYNKLKIAFYYENPLTDFSNVFGNSFGLALGYKLIPKAKQIPSYF